MEDFSFNSNHEIAFHFQPFTRHTCDRQQYIIITVMAPFMRVPFMFVLNQSNCVSAIKRLIFYYRHKSIFVLFHVLACSLLLPYVLKSIALRV